MPLAFATWNVNSIRARLNLVLGWIDRVHPDVVCMQETKVVDGLFPRQPFESRGYAVECFGQKTYNGVALASKRPIERVVRGFSEAAADEDRRLIEATIDGIRVVNVYVPNGRALDSPFFQQKIAWLTKLRSRLEEVAKEPLLLCGDFNVAPADLDVYDPEAYRDQLHCHPEEREALARAVGCGLVDVLRRRHPDARIYSWWDYRQLAFRLDRGLRIDMIYMSEDLARRCSAASVDREPRKGPNPSDHAPVIARVD